MLPSLAITDERLLILNWSGPAAVKPVKSASVKSIINSPPCIEIPVPSIVVKSKPTPFALTATGTVLPPVVVSARTINGSPPAPIKPSPATEPLI